MDLINPNFPDDPSVTSSSSPLPLDYSNPRRKPIAVPIGRPEDVVAYIFRRMLFALGVGLLLAGIGDVYSGYDRSNGPVLMGIGGGLVGLCWKAWRYGV